MKIYQCQSCHAAFKNETDSDAHAGNDPENHQIREYELEEFLTRFLASA